MIRRGWSLVFMLVAVISCAGANKWLLTPVVPYPQECGYPIGLTEPCRGKIVTWGVISCVRCWRKEDVISPRSERVARCVHPNNTYCVGEELDCEECRSSPIGLGSQSVPVAVDGGVSDR